MIVLDEQLHGRDLENQIARWYQGAVCFITDLRPEMIHYLTQSRNGWVK
jgi:hypothetical protein